MLTESHIGYHYQRGGYIALRYTPIEHIAQYLFAQINGQFRGKMQFVQGSAVHVPFPHMKIAERFWVANSKKGKNGTLYEVGISGLLKDVTPKVLSELEDMSDREFVLTLETPDKTTWLVGTPETPSVFSFNADGRNQANDLSRIRFRFDSRLAHPITAI